MYVGCVCTKEIGEVAQDCILAYCVHQYRYTFCKILIHFLSILEENLKNEDEIKNDDDNLKNEDDTKNEENPEIEKVCHSW